MKPKISLLLSLLVSVWVIYDFLAPGEAMDPWVVALNCFVLFGACMGAIGAIIQLRAK